VTRTFELPANEHPRVSILIAAFNAPTFGPCLRSLAEHLPDVNLEVVAALNGSSRELGAAAADVRGVRMVDAPANLGFAAGCNLARSVATGELLVLVQDDVQIEAGWLEALLTAADTHPEAGAVGGMASWPGDRRVQNAGVIVWSDGSHTELGRGEYPAAAASGGLRAVDTCSSNSLLVRTDTWDAIGGLDDDFFPAGHVDADLAMRIRRHGQVVMSEPSARVVHARSSSTTRHYQRFIAVRNGLRFQERWRSVLERDHEPPGERGPEELARALDRAERTRRRAAERLRGKTPASAAPGDQSRPELFSPPADPAERLAVGLRYNERHLELRIVHQAEMEVALDRLEAEAERLRTETRELHAELERLRGRLEAIETGGWWRLRERLLPLLRAAERVAPVGSRRGSRADQG